MRSALVVGLLRKSWAVAAVTVRVTVVVCVAAVPVPVTVIAQLPAGVLAPTPTVIVEEPPEVTDGGLKLTVVPAGWPLALRLTVCAEPLVTAVLIVEVPLPPAPILRLQGGARFAQS